jgi:hypothetical protein
MTPEERQAAKREAARRWRRSHPEAVREKKRRYRARHPDVVAAGQRRADQRRKEKGLPSRRAGGSKRLPEEKMIERARHRAKKHSREFDLKVSDIVIPDVCPILGIPLFHATGVSSDNSPSLDRIDNDKGYVRGNVCVISNKANRLKRHLTLADLDRLREYILRAG